MSANSDTALAELQTDICHVCISLYFDFRTLGHDGNAFHTVQSEQHFEQGCMLTHGQCHVESCEILHLLDIELN